VDVVRATEEADVACVLKGQEDGSWSVSMRSRGGTDLSRVAMALGGGGHRAAAGYTSNADRETTMARLRAELTAAA
jgi:phosphoesterase RecJ-like protein